MKAIGITGPSDAGKTTLIERLIPVLDERGRVATVKSIHHDIEVDEEGKDTYRHRMAGAETVVGVTPSLTFTVERQESGSDGATVLRRRLAEFENEGFAYVLVEGFGDTPLPRIIVGRREFGERSDPVIARVTDVESAGIGELAERIDQLDDWRPTRKRT